MPRTIDCAIWRRKQAHVAVGALSFSLLAATAAAQEPARWRLIPELRLGLDAPNAYEFSRILAVVPAPDGSVVVADSRNKEIAVFNASGAFTHTIGRNGRGPGEFLRLYATGMLADTLWVIDADERRTSLFAIDGKLHATIRTEIVRSASLQWNGFLSAILPNGQAFGSAGQGMRTARAFRDVPAPLFLMNRAGRILDTLAWARRKEGSNFLWRPDDSGGLIVFQPFTDGALIVHSSTTSQLFIVDRTVATSPANASFEVLAIKSTGDTLWKRSYPYTPRRLEEARADSFRTVVGRLTRHGFTRAEIQGFAFIPEFYSPVSSAIAGSDGSLWLRREEGRPTVDYWVIGTDGRSVATLSVPANLTIMAVTATKAWGVERDEYDVPTVRRFSIQR